MYNMYCYDSYSGIEAGQLLPLLPEHLLGELALSTGVDKYTNKLHGEFFLSFYYILSFKGNILRTMELAYASLAFQLLNAQAKSQKIRFSSISEVLTHIQPAYFEELCQVCVEQYDSLLAPAEP